MTREHGRAPYGGGGAQHRTGIFCTVVVVGRCIELVVGGFCWRPKTRSGGGGRVGVCDALVPVASAGLTSENK